MKKQVIICCHSFLSHSRSIDRLITSYFRFKSTSTENNFAALLIIFSYIWVILWLKVQNLEHLLPVEWTHKRNFEHQRGLHGDQHFHHFLTFHQQLYKLMNRIISRLINDGLLIAAPVCFVVIIKSILMKHHEQKKPSESGKVDTYLI